MSLNKLSDYEKIAKIWQIELNMEYLKPEKNVRLSFKDIGPFCEYLALDYLTDYHGGGSGGMGFDLVKNDMSDAYEVKSCCTIQNAKCKNPKCEFKFNDLFTSYCPICSSKDYKPMSDSRFGINSKETLDQVNQGIFAGFILCHIFLNHHDAKNKTVIVGGEWYKINFSDDDIKDIQLKYFENQHEFGKKDVCNLLPNSFDFYKLCPLQIKKLRIIINYENLDINPKVIIEDDECYPKVPASICKPDELVIFKTLESFNPTTNTADCKDFTLNLDYREKSLGKDRGDTRSRLYNKMKKQNN